MSDLNAWDKFIIIGGTIVTIIVLYFSWEVIFDIFKHIF